MIDQLPYRVTKVMCTAGCPFRQWGVETWDGRLVSQEPLSHEDAVALCERLIRSVSAI